MQLQARAWPLTEEGYQRLGSNAEKVIFFFWRNVRQEFGQLAKEVGLSKSQVVDGYRLSGFILMLAVVDVH